MPCCLSILLGWGIDEIKTQNMLSSSTWTPATKRSVFDEVKPHNSLVATHTHNSHTLERLPPTLQILFIDCALFPQGKLHGQNVAADPYELTMMIVMIHNCCKNRIMLSAIKNTLKPTLIIIILSAIIHHLYFYSFSTITHPCFNQTSLANEHPMSLSFRREWRGVPPTRS